MKPGPPPLAAMRPNAARLLPCRPKGPNLPRLRRTENRTRDKRATGEALCKDQASKPLNFQTSTKGARPARGPVGRGGLRTPRFGEGALTRPRPGAGDSGVRLTPPRPCRRFRRFRRYRSAPAGRRMSCCAKRRQPPSYMSYWSYRSYRGVFRRCRRFRRCRMAASAALYDGLFVARLSRVLFSVLCSPGRVSAPSCLRGKGAKAAPFAFARGIWYLMRVFGL